MQHDYSEFDVHAEQVDASGLKRLAELAQRQYDVEQMVTSYMAQAKEAQDILNTIRNRELPDLMDELGLMEFTTAGGIKLKLTEKIRGSIPKGHQG